MGGHKQGINTQRNPSKASCRIDTLTPYLRPSAVLGVDGGHLPRNLLLLSNYYYYYYYSALCARSLRSTATCTEKGSNCSVSLPLRKGERRVASISYRVHVEAMNSELDTQSPPS